jgi:hypothetical protein
MTKRFMAVIAIGIVVLALVLPLSVGQAQVPAAPSASTTTRFRLVNAANTSTGLDLAVDGTKSLVIVGILSLKTSKYDTILTAGNHTITLFQTGTLTPVGTALTFNFAARTNYTIVLLPDMTWVEYTDTNPSPAPGTSNARLINLSPNNNPASLAVDGTVPIDFTNIAYKSAGATYLNLLIGAHNLTVPSTLAKAKAFTFLDGHVYSIMLFWDAAKSLPVIVPENDTNILAGTPTATMTPTVTNTPTATTAPTAINTPIPTIVPTVAGTSLPPSPDTLFLPLLDK